MSSISRVRPPGGARLRKDAVQDEVEEEREDVDAELTNRSRDAINAASSRAVSGGHPDLTPAHLLLALLQGQDNENITDLLAAVEADQAAVRSGRRAGAGRAAQRDRAPPSRRRSPTASCSPSSPTPAQRAKELGDEYLSTEHLLIGIAAKGGQAGDVLTEQGASAEEAAGRLPEEHGEGAG